MLHKILLLQYSRIQFCRCYGLSCNQYVFVAANTIPFVDVTVVLYFQQLQYTERV